MTPLQISIVCNETMQHCSHQSNKMLQGWPVNSKRWWRPQQILGLKRRFQHWEWLHRISGYFVNSSLIKDAVKDTAWRISGNVQKCPLGQSGINGIDFCRGSTTSEYGDTKEVISDNGSSLQQDIMLHSGVKVSTSSLYGCSTYPCQLMPISYSDIHSGWEHSQVTFGVHPIYSQIKKEEVDVVAVKDTWWEIKLLIPQ